MKFKSVIHKNGTITTEVVDRGHSVTSTAFQLQETAAPNAPEAHVPVPAEAKVKRVPGAKSAGTAARADDPRVVDLLKALKRDRKLAGVVSEFEAAREAAGRSFGSNGLKGNGKLFALFTRGTLVVKLPAARVAKLVAEGVGQPFDPGHGRLMKGWLTITNPAASWIDLAKEAHEFVKGATG